MNKILITSIAAVIIAALPANAQTLDQLHSGDRIRLQLGASRFTVVFDSVSTDSLMYRTSTSNRTIALSAIGEIQRARRGKSKSGKGAVVGLVTGGVIGGMLGYAASCIFACQEDSMSYAAKGALAVGLPSAAIGAAIGSAIRSTVWEPVKKQ